MHLADMGRTSKALACSIRTALLFLAACSFAQSEKASARTSFALLRQDFGLSVQ